MARRMTVLVHYSTEPTHLSVMNRVQLMGTVLALTFSTLSQRSPFVISLKWHDSRRPIEIV